MSPQFKSWAVANLEFLISGSAVLLSLIIMCFLPLPEDVSFAGYFVLYIFVAALLSPSKTFSAAITKFVITLLLTIVMGGILWTKGCLGLSIFTFLLLLTSFIPSKMIAAYARENIDDVLSSRMLWRNSDVSLFEITWKYVADRFMGTFSTINIWWLLFVAMILQCYHPEFFDK